MKKTEKPQRLYFTSTEKNLISELAATAPAVLISLQKLIKAGNGEIYFKDFRKINLLIFLLSEFEKRTVLKQESEINAVENSEKDS